MKEYELSKTYATIKRSQQKDNRKGKKLIHGALII